MLLARLFHVIIAQAATQCVSLQLAGMPGPDVSDGLVTTMSMGTHVLDHI